LLVFMTSEYTRLNLENIAPGLSLEQAARDDRVHILTCSRWSAKAIAASGFPPSKVFVVPHGVVGSSFTPTSPKQKSAIRSRLGIADDEFVFLHVGAGTFNKGLDLVIRTFARQTALKPRQRLIIKGLDAIYGNAISNIARLSDVQAAVAELIARGQLLYIGGDLSDAQMDELYRLADTYVTPYRAEGFNIPALEAAARGLKVIATEGGSTDDFLHCFPNVIGVGARLSALPQGLEFLEPDRISLDAAIDNAAQRIDSSEGGEDQAARFSWAAVSHQLNQRLYAFPFRS
jgi:glycosyltransferase involved in cell wall biosynthesis